MNWKILANEKPVKNDVYLCDVEDHYAILQFLNGEFIGNDYSEVVADNFESRYIGYAKNIYAWMELPKFLKKGENLCP